MAANRPIVLSDLPLFIELTEGKGEYFPPADAGAMADAIDHLLDSGERQRELVACGDRHGRDFGFERLAAELDEIQRRVIGSG